MIDQFYIFGFMEGCHNTLRKAENEEGTILEKSVLEEPLEKEHEIAEMAAAYMKQHVKEG